MLIRRWGILRIKESKLVKDMKETNLSYEKLGKKYGVSRQAIYGFCKRHGIRRPRRQRRHQTKRCHLCQKLIQISKRPHSEFISSGTIRKEVRVKSGDKYRSHLRMLRSKGMVSKKFGRVRSKRVEKAYAIYFTKGIPIGAIGRELGLKNFYSIINKHRELGWNVPPSLYAYNRQERSGIQREIQRRKKHQRRYVPSP